MATTLAPVGAHIGRNLRRAVSIAIILRLCWILPAVTGSDPELVGAGCGNISAEQQEQIVCRHNFHRARVHPYASNMRKLAWNGELADMAQSFAEDCVVSHYVHGKENVHGIIGQNIHIIKECEEEIDFTEVIDKWYKESYYYHFATSKCNPLCTCDRYLQMVWAQTHKMGCGIAYCTNPMGYYSSNIYLFVCYYAPGPPKNINFMRPYELGNPCSECGDSFPECKPKYSLTKEDVGYNLCYNSEGVCIGSDPHFGIRLPDGSLLCYSFQGEHNSTFNIISNSQLEMNALFVPDSRRVNNTWIGSVGITTYHNGKSTTLQFTAVDQLVHIGARVLLNAKSVSKISFNFGKLTILETPRNFTPKFPRVEVEFLDSQLHFTVAFVHNAHINVEWHNTGEAYGNSKGVVGQFFRQGVRIDRDNQILHIPQREPIPVIRRPLWSFMRHNLAEETECWTSTLPSNQGVGLIDGTWTNYKVKGLIAN